MQRSNMVNGHWLANAIEIMKPYIKDLLHITDIKRITK